MMLLKQEEKRDLKNKINKDEIKNNWEIKIIDFN